MFEVDLVYVDSKLPFKKHFKNGKVFVEAEPGAEYWVRLKEQPNNTHSICKIQISVDGRPTDRMNCKPNAYNTVMLCGSFDGCSKVNCLRFVVANKTDADEERSFEQIIQSLGRVNIDVYDALLDSSNVSTAKEPTEPFNNCNIATLAVDKSVRSATGKHAMDVGLSAHQYTRGRLLESHVLHYCCTPTLIWLGVIPGLASPSKKRNIKDVDDNPTPSHRYVTQKFITKETTPSGMMVTKEHELIDMTNDDED